MNAEKISAVAFDMDGLIFETESLARISFFQVAEFYGLEVDEQFYQGFVGNSQPVCDRLMRRRFGDDFATAEFRDKWWGQVHTRIDNDGVDFKPGFHRLFALIERAGLPIALVTTSRQESVLRNFKEWDYPRRFNTMITWDRGLPAKPAPDKYLAAAQDMRAKPANLLALEDSNVGMSAAINAGCQAVMVPDIAEPSAQVQDGAKHIFNNLNLVADWLQEIL